MKMLYKYPQVSFPYADLVAVNAARGLQDREYELIDTGVFTTIAISTLRSNMPKQRPMTFSCWSRRTIAGRRLRGSICSRKSGPGISGRGALFRRSRASRLAIPIRYSSAIPTCRRCGAQAKAFDSPIVTCRFENGRHTRCELILRKSIAFPKRPSTRKRQDGLRKQNFDYSGRVKVPRHR